MKDSPLDQTVALIERHQRILLCTHRKPDGDAIGSIMGLARALKLMGKDVVASCSDQLPEQFEFLPNVSDLQQDVHGQQDFVITLDCDNTEVDRLKYHLEDNKIHIVVTPKSGSFSPEKVSSYQQQGDFDLIITVDVADIPQLGKLYDDNKDLFMKLPVINIDHHVSNTEFGKLNWIDVTASSTAEILFGLVKELETRSGKTLLSPEAATFFLSGVTTDTGSFQNANTTPKSMEVAADLMDAGANQHDVVKYLFRTKKLSTLKLWGKILSKIEVDERHRLVWSSITQQDLISSGADMAQAGDIIDELLVHAPEADIVALFKEDNDMVSVSMRSTTHLANVMEIAQKFHGGGHVQAAGAKFNEQSLSEVMNAVLPELQKAQGKRLGLDAIKLADQDAAAGKVTQVLEGFTPVHNKPTIQEQVEKAPSPVTLDIPEGSSPAVSPDKKPAELSAVEEASVMPSVPPKTVPAVPVIPPQAVAPLIPAAEVPKPALVPPADIHESTKAAIQAEQSQPSSSPFSPSQASAENRNPNPNPQKEKRFTDTVPDFLKPAAQTAPPPQVIPPITPISPAPTAPVVPTTPTSPTASTPPISEPFIAPVSPTTPAMKGNSGGAQTSGIGTTGGSTGDDDDGVTVKITDASTAAPAPIAQDSSEPVVKNMNPTSPPASGSGSGITQAATQTPPVKPEAPKDPFSLGDDGLTDIERALGGL